MTFLTIMPYKVILLLLFGGIAMDIYGIVASIKLGGDELHNYARTFVKVIKIALSLMFSAVLFYIAFKADISAVYKAVHIALGSLLFADSAVCLYIKLRHGKKR